MKTPYEPIRPERAGAVPAAAPKWARPARSRTHQVRWRQQVLLFVLLMLFGIILMSHVQSVDANATRVGLAEQYAVRQAELQQFEQQNLKLQQENVRLLEEKARRIENLLIDTGNSAVLKDLERYKILAGMSEVRGPGVALTITDKPDYDILTDPADAIVHDADMRYAFRLLQENGATGIAVNGVRYVNTTEIYCIGPTILVSGNRLVPPYVISATGDQQRLLDAFAADPYFALRTMQPTGIVAQAKKLDSVTLPAFQDADQLEKYISLLEVPKP